MNSRGRANSAVGPALVMSFQRRIVIVGAVGLGILLALGTLFVRRQFTYPAAWDQVHVGMSRQEVYDRIGPGAGNGPVGRAHFIITATRSFGMNFNYR
jgi:hypothetical protein